MNHRDVSIIPFKGKTPVIHPSAFIAPGCRIIGDVTIGEDVSIWYNCVLRADVCNIVVGARTNIQDGSVIHVDSPDEGHPDGFPTIIGEDVLIGHMAMVHSCVLGDRSFIGMNASLLGENTVGEEAMLGAGALLTPRKTIPPRELWTGRPAKMMRTLDDAAIADMQSGVAHYVENGRAHRAEIEAMNHG